jgi:hypothetical protein
MRALLVSSSADCCFRDVVPAVAVAIANYVNCDRCVEGHIGLGRGACLTGVAIVRERQVINAIAGTGINLNGQPIENSGAAFRKSESGILNAGAPVGIEIVIW